MLVIHALAAANAIVRWLQTHLGAAQTARTAPSTAGSAWTGPWPPGALPVCVSYGNGEPIFVGYVAASTEAGPRRNELCTFWRAHAAALESHRVGGRRLMPGTFEVYQDLTGAWQFRLRAHDGRVAALNAIQRHPFDSSDAARQGCDVVKVAAAAATIEERQ